MNSKIIHPMSYSLNIDIWNHYIIHSKIELNGIMKYRIWDSRDNLYATGELTYDELKEVLKEMVLIDASKEVDRFFKNSNLMKCLVTRGVTCGYMRDRNPFGDWEKEGTDTLDRVVI